MRRTVQDPRLWACATLAAALLAALPATAGVVTQHYELAAPEIRDIGECSRIVMDGAWSFGARGEPVLPTAPVRILIAPGEAIVNLAVIPGEKIVLREGVLVEVGQGQHPLSFPGPFERVEPDYAGRSSFPGRLHDEPRVGHFRGYAIATLALHPVEHDPDTGAVSYYSSMDVEITTAPESGSERVTRRMIRHDTATTSRLSGLVDNPAARTRYVEVEEKEPDSPLLDPSRGYRYVIITTDAWDDYLGEFVDFQTRRGLKAAVFLKSWIAARYAGVDEAEQIRSFIIDAYRTWGIDYVLLVGDAMDPEGIPHRGLYAYAAGGATGGGRESDVDIPADLYYAGLDGSWNDDGDGKWGEPGEADLYQEVAVGRACVNTVAEVQNFVRKTMTYQDDPVVAECDQAIMVGEYLWPATYGGTYKQEILDGSDANGYTTTGFPGTMDVTTLYELDWDWDAGTLIGIMESGTNIVNHLGHCDIHWVMKMTPMDIASFDNDGTNHSLNFLYSQGCYGGAFDNRTIGGYYTTDCFTEEFVTDDDGAVAAITNSRYGWGQEGGTNGSSQLFDREFFDAMFGEGIYALGEANGDSKADAVWAIDYGANRWCCYQTNLFGDPAMHLWTAEPAELDVDHPLYVQTHHHILDVVVRDGSGVPVEGARVTIYTDDYSVYGTGTTDGGGLVALTSDPGSTGTLHLKVTAHDFLTYDGEVAVVSATDPYLVVSGHAVDDDGSGESAGNGDGVVNAGETIELAIDLENLGGGVAYGVVGMLSSTGQFVTIVDGDAEYGDIPGSESATSVGGYVIAVAPDAPDGEAVSVALTVTDARRETWELSLDLEVSAPVVQYATHDVDDSPSGGDGSGCAEAGETIVVSVSLANTGSAATSGVIATLSTTYGSSTRAWRAWTRSRPVRHGRSIPATRRPSFPTARVRMRSASCFR